MPIIGRRRGRDRSDSDTVDGGSPFRVSVAEILYSTPAVILRHLLHNCQFMLTIHTCSSSRLPLSFVEVFVCKKFCDDPGAAAPAPASRVGHSRNTIGQKSLRLGPYPHRAAATQQRHLGRHEATMEAGGPWE